mgnify:CR=1 FL=1
MKKKYSISMICAPKTKFDSAINFLILHNCFIHIDVMEKDFSNFEGFSCEEIARIREKYPLAVMDVHIMAYHPEKYVKFCIDHKCDIISFHIEGCQNTKALLSEINLAGLKSGLAIKPDSKLEMLYEYLDDVDQINVMTVYPGPAGQCFQKQELNKVINLNNLRLEKEYAFDIEVDGSCNKEHFYMIEDAGTDIFVLGNSGLFALNDDIEKAWKQMVVYTSEDSLIYLHADLVGNSLKECVKAWLNENNFCYVDLYTDGLEEYPECARELGKLVLESPRNYGILCCGTGIGMAIVANKIPFIRAAVVSDCYSAKMAKEHNNANVLCMGSRVVTREQAYMILDCFFKNKFLYGKHTSRVDRYEIGNL